MVDFCLPPDNSQSPLALSLVDSHSNLTMVLKSELYHPNSMTEKAKAERQEVACLMEKAMAPHSSTLAWKIPWMEEPGGLQSMGSLESDTTERLHFHFSLSCIEEGNGNPLQCSCLENPRDGGAW